MENIGCSQRRCTRNGEPTHISPSALQIEVPNQLTRSAKD